MAGPTGPTRSSVTRGRRLGVLGLLLAAALFLLVPAAAQAAGDEGMDSFAAVYDVQPDGGMKVTESITWRFPSGAPDAFRVTDNGAAKEIRIGSADEYTSGTQVYTISYTLHDVLNPITADGKPAADSSTADTVELYYNVFGTNETTVRDRVSI